MRVFSKGLGKYCTVVSTKQLKKAKEAGIPEAKITVEVYVNINGQKETPHYKKLELTETKFKDLKFI